MSDKNKQLIEKVKTIVIAVLITGILAFVAGNVYAQNVNNSIVNEAKNLKTVLSDRPAEQPTPATETQALK